MSTHELFTLEHLALHAAAKYIWLLILSEYPGEMSKKLSMIDDIIKRPYKRTFQKAFPRILSEEFPKLIKEKLFCAIIDLRLGFAEANDWEEWYYSDLDAISPEICYSGGLLQMGETFEEAVAGKYKSMNFIKPLGRFDDLSWAKMFVADQDQPLKSRFCLACLYCFEEEIQSLWSTMTVNNQILRYDDLRNVENRNKSLVTLWMARLRRVTGDSFFADGWKWAFNGCHEQAAAYFFRHCSESEKTKILSELNWEHIYVAAQKGHSGFVYFIYSLLTLELKGQLISFKEGYCEGCDILICMLCSSYYKSILYDTLLYPHAVPIRYYKRILEKLVAHIEFSPIPRRKEIFKILWNRLSKDEKMDAVCASSILKNLIEINDFDLLELFLLNLPHSLKEEILLTTRFSIKYFRRNSYEGFLRYLLFLLLNYDDVSKTLTLRADAGKLIQIFIERSPSYIEFRNFNWMTECLTNILPVVGELINEMDQSTTIHDFLAKNIQPITCIREMYVRDKLRWRKRLDIPALGNR